MGVIRAVRFEVCHCQANQPLHGFVLGEGDVRIVDVPITNLGVGHRELDKAFLDGRVSSETAATVYLEMQAAGVPAEGTPEFHEATPEVPSCCSACMFGPGGATRVRVQSPDCSDRCCCDHSH